MSTRVSRRALLGAATTGGAILGLGDVSFLSRLPPADGAEAAPATPAHLNPERATC